MTYCGIRGNVWLLKVVITRTYVIIIVAGAINHRGTIDDPLGGTLLRRRASARFMNLHDWRASLSRDRSVRDRLRLPGAFLAVNPARDVSIAGYDANRRPNASADTIGAEKNSIINATFRINKW